MAVFDPHKLSKITCVHDFSPDSCPSRGYSLLKFEQQPFFTDMATAVVVGVGAVAAAILGRSIIKRGLFVGKGAAEFAKGGFRAKMDRKEAIQILGLTCALCSTF